MANTYNYVIVGAGSAGCVLANRLSEDLSNQVLLIEAGGSDQHLFVKMPAAFSLPMGKRRFDWCFEAEAEPGLDGRRLACPRGRLLGGSSSINGMVWVRGSPQDYNRWQSMGAQGWDYAHCLPYFKRAERVATQTADPTWRGTTGPIVISRGTRENPLYEAFLGSAEAAGYPLSADLNGYQQEGFGDLEMSIDQGVRCSAARAYLAPARARPNLTVVTNAQVEAVLLDGQTATGVRYHHRGAVQTAQASKELILAAGSIGSPHLLQLSGIGPGSALSPHGIAIRHELPGVGANLMDHLEVYLQQACVPGVSLNRQLGLFGKARIGLEWLTTRRGAGATNHFEAGGFIRSTPSTPWPDIQLHFLPAAVSYDGSRAAREDGFQVHIGPMLSPSRGNVTLRSADPAQPPRIQFNYMSHADDWSVFRSAIRQAREIFAQAPLAHLRRDEIAPGALADHDEALNTFVREHAESAYHPSGTCRMGEDEDAVVDSQCRVHGIERLRVVDSSIFPHITNGNLNAPTIMVAERAADLILGREPLPPLHVPVWPEPIC